MILKTLERYLLRVDSQLLVCCSELVLWCIIIIIWGRGRENRREAEGEDVFRGQMARYEGRCWEEDRREGTEDMTGCGRGAEGRGHE